MRVFLEELRRRNVWRALLAYLAAAWFLIEVADTIFPRLGFSDAAVTKLIIILAIGVVPALVLSWFFELTPEGLKRDSDVVPDSAMAPRRGKILDRIIVLMLTLAVGFLAIDKFVLDPARDAQKIEEAAAQARAEAELRAYGERSIAVLAFSDMSPDGDHEYFSDGISEELLNLLSTVAELRVTSRSSAFSFKGSRASIPEIAEKLRVSYILEGSVRKSGERVRVTAQLIDAKTDAHVWSQTYDRTLDDIFAIQDEISGAIVDQLKVELLNDIEPTRKIDTQSYEKYLKAQFIVHSENRGQIREAQALLNEVLEKEPNYIPAINALARLYYRIPKVEGGTIAGNKEEIEALAGRVIAIEPGGSSALVWQGWLAYLRGDMQEAASFYEKAMAVDPNYLSLLRVLIPFLRDIGRIDEAIELGNYLVLRDPVCGACVSNLASAYRAAGRYEEAVGVLEDMLDWHAPAGGHYWSIGVAQLHAGQPAKALEAFELESLEGNRELGSIMALYDLGRMEEFEVRFSDFIGDNHDRESVARIYAWIGDTDKAIDTLYAIIERDGPSVLRDASTGLYEKIKSDSRWRELRQQYGYTDEPIEPVEFVYVPPAGLGND